MNLLVMVLEVVLLVGLSASNWRKTSANMSLFNGGWDFLLVVFVVLAKLKLLNDETSVVEALHRVEESSFILS